MTDQPSAADRRAPRPPQRKDNDLVTFAEVRTLVERERRSTDQDVAIKLDTQRRQFEEMLKTRTVAIAAAERAALTTMAATCDEFRADIMAMLERRTWRYRIRHLFARVRGSHA